MHGLQTKRLFFGIHVEALWPKDFPRGRIIPEKMRHMTLAFLGDVKEHPLITALESCVKPAFKLGLTGMADKILFLSPNHPRVVAYHIDAGSHLQSILQYQKELLIWLKTLGYEISDDRPFLPHVTVARSPFDKREWSREFIPFPAVMSSIHLYESTGNLTYVPLWTHSLIPPFEEKAHTADVAFLIRGASFDDLHAHAKIALASIFPEIYKYFSVDKVQSVVDIVIKLNEGISRCDTELGSPFKAVSFHGEAQEINDHLLEWEMIIDV